MLSVWNWRKKDRPKGVVIRDQAMKQWELDEEAFEKLTAIQDYFKEDSLEERESFGKIFLSQLKKLFSLNKSNREA